MSTMVCLKEDGTVILATDSRACVDRGKCFMSDAEPKILELLPGLFYAYCGYTSLADTHRAVAATLTAQTGDLRKFADELDAASRPQVERLVDYLVTGRFQEQVSGTVPFHAYVLCGVSEGRPDFLTREFWIKNGQIIRQDAYYFDEASAGYISPGQLVADVVTIPETWAGGLIPAAERLLDHLRQASPFVGGPTQMIALDRSGARWVHQLEAPVSVEYGITEKVAMNLGGGLQINPTTKQVEAANLDITKFAASVRPVSLFSTDPALPDANYPAGAYGFNVATHTFKRVADDGNSWVLAVNGGKDIQAGTISADRLIVSDVVAACISAGLVSASYLSANYTSTIVLAANYATITYLGVNYLSASQISATYASIAALHAEQINVSRLQAGTATFTGDVTFARSGGPSLTINSSQIAFTQSGSTYVSISPSNPSVNVYDPLYGYSMGARLIAYGGGALALYGPGGNASINCGSGNPVMYMGVNQVLTVRYPGSPSTLADVIAVLRWHGLCN